MKGQRLVASPAIPRTYRLSLPSFAGLFVVAVCIAVMMPAVATERKGKKGPKKTTTKAPKAGDTRVNKTDGAEMVFLPGGKFTMGGKGDTYGPDQEPAHEQSVKGFWMATKEVTRGQYRKFMKANPKWSIEGASADICDGVYLRYWRESFAETKDDNLPVLNIPWSAAVAYAEWAGGRLPTEAEWEFAARGGKQLEYASSTGKYSTKIMRFNAESPVPVGSYPPNPYGIYDLAGNAEEYCSSLHKEYPYQADDGREDLTAPGARITRGGSWKECIYQRARSACRAKLLQGLCRGLVGFRIASSP